MLKSCSNALVEFIANTNDIVFDFKGQIECAVAVVPSHKLLNGRGAFKIAIDHQLPVVPMVFYDCKRKHPWHPNFGYPGELRVQTYAEIYPPQSKEEIEIFQEEVRDVVEKGLIEDPKRRQYAAVEIEKLIAQKA